jgi:hypothetical protein
MKKAASNPKQFELMRMLDQFLKERGIELHNRSKDSEFLERISSTIREYRENGILIHGIRAQTMFSYFASALGGCKMINEEDSGEFFTVDKNIKRPDFRLLTNDGVEFFVEAKNFNQSDPQEPYSLKSSYAHQLRAYAQEFKKPLLFAIFWRRWHQWTLTPLACFSNDGDAYRISLPIALANDHKALLGDRHIGIPKPLTMRFYTDPKKPRNVDSDGHTQFTVGRVAFLAGGKEITDQFEQQLAWFFLHYGSWEDIKQSGSIENNALLWVDWEGIREDRNPEQDFLMIGQLSEMLTRQFNSLTVNQQQVIRLSPTIAPEALGVLIPAAFQGDVLKIWKFQLNPAKSEFPQFRSK